MKNKTKINIDARTIGNLSLGPADEAGSFELNFGLNMVMVASKHQRAS